MALRSIRHETHSAFTTTSVQHTILYKTVVFLFLTSLYCCNKLLFDTYIVEIGQVLSRDPTVDTETLSTTQMSRLNWEAVFGYTRMNINSEFVLFSVSRIDVDLKLS